MNTMLRKTQKVVQSLMIAILTAGILTGVAFAGGPYTRTEGTTSSQNLYLWPNSPGSQAKQTLTSSNCAGGYCGTFNPRY